MIFIRLVFLVPLLVCCGILAMELSRRIKGTKRATQTWRTAVHFSFFFSLIYLVFLYFVMQQLNEYSPRY